MPVIIPDQLLAEAGLSEHAAKLEIACRLYDAGKLTMPQATRLAEISRIDLEAALLERGLPLLRLAWQGYWTACIGKWPSGGTGRSGWAFIEVLAPTNAVRVAELRSLLSASSTGVDSQISLVRRVDSVPPPRPPVAPPPAPLPYSYQL